MDDIGFPQKPANTLPTSDLNAIIDRQFAGDIQGAHDAYVKFFEEHDIEFEALNLFGICCTDLGKFEKAEGIFKLIIQDAPWVSEASLHLADLLIKHGRADEALVVLSHENLTDLEDDKFPIKRGQIQVAMGNIESAIAELEFAMRLRPDNLSTLIALSGLHLERGEYERALSYCQKILFDEPSNREALLAQSEIFLKQENWDASLANTTLLLKRNPRDLRAGQLQCHALFKNRKMDEFLEVARTMANVAPNDSRIMSLLCHGFMGVDQLDLAILAANHALSLDPKLRDIMELRANCHFRLGLMKEALAYIDETLTHFPDDFSLHRNRGVVLERLCKIDEAIEVFNKLEKIDPEKKSVRFNKSMCLFLQGQYKAGFKYYESRFNREASLLPSYRGVEPLLDALDDIEGKHILLHPEQGFGDTIMACRFTKFLQGNGAKVTLAVPRALFSLMESLDTDAKLVSVGENVGKIDYHCPLLSLPHLTADQWDDIPAPQKYLSAPAACIEKWESILGASDKLRVGFVCSGNSDHANDGCRSLNMTEFLKNLPVGAEYHLLQKELRDTDHAALAIRNDVKTHYQLIGDFADTAALCEHMDLIVSVDTSVVHLAGALGRPTLLMVPFWPDWRWGLDKKSNAWYPSIKLVRQQEIGSWRSVLNYVGDQIERAIKTKAK